MSRSLVPLLRMSSKERKGKSIKDPAGVSTVAASSLRSSLALSLFSSNQVTVPWGVIVRSSFVDPRRPGGVSSAPPPVGFGEVETHAG